MEQTENKPIREQTPYEIKDANYRLNIRRGVKGEYGYEFTVRGDTIEELKARADAMRNYLKIIGIDENENFKTDTSK